MKTIVKKVMIITSLVASMAAVTTAQADDQGQRGPDNRNGGPGGQFHGPQDRGNAPQGRSQWQGGTHGGGNPQWQGQRFRAPAPYFRPQGYQARSWRGGDRLPRGYFGHRYYVDYRQYHLNPPPYGYRWVRVDNDVVLVAVSTGIIASVVSGLYY